MNISALAESGPPEDRAARAFVAEAQSLRGLMAHTLAATEFEIAGRRRRADLGPDLSMSDLARRYDTLVCDWINEPPEGLPGCVAYLELAGEIMARHAAGLAPLSSLDPFIAAALVRLSRGRLSELADAEG